MKNHFKETSMNFNVGALDRGLRIVIAAVLVILYLNGIVAGKWGMGLLVVAGILFLTAIFRFCPIYRIFGLNSCPR